MVVEKGRHCRRSLGFPSPGRRFGDKLCADLPLPTSLRGETLEVVGHHTTLRSAPVAPYSLKDILTISRTPSPPSIVSCVRDGTECPDDVRPSSQAVCKLSPRPVYGKIQKSYHATRGSLASLLKILFYADGVSCDTGMINSMGILASYATPNHVLAETGRLPPVPRLQTSWYRNCAYRD